MLQKWELTSYLILWETQKHWETLSTDDILGEGEHVVFVKSIPSSNSTFKFMLFHPKNLIFTAVSILSCQLNVMNVLDRCKVLKFQTEIPINVQLNH